MTQAVIRRLGAMPAWVGVTLLLSACTSTLPYYRYHYQPDALSAGVQRVLLRPAVVDSELEIDPEPLNREVARYLEAHGHQVVPWERAQTHWKAVFDNAELYHPSSGSFDPEKAEEHYREFLGRLRAHDVCNAVVEVGVVGRKAKLSGVVGVWDGTRQRIRDPRGAQYKWSGVGSALSVRLDRNLPGAGRRQEDLVGTVFQLREHRCHETIRRALQP